MDKKNFKRHFVQLCTAFLYNPAVANFFSSSITAYKTKYFCVPGINCYSCPAAIFSCPLGSLQNALLTGSVPLFIGGLILLFSTIFGRLTCAYFCPVGLIQDLLFYIHTPKIKKTERTLKVTRKLSLFKYIILFAILIFLPVAAQFLPDVSKPYFCAWLCPAGTVQAGIPLVIMNKNIAEATGIVFAIKCAVALCLGISALFILRPFCSFFCPLGALYSFFNKVAVLGPHVKKENCTKCGVCAAKCNMQTKIVNDRECIRCGKCASSCPHNAIITHINHIGKRTP